MNNNLVYLQIWEESDKKEGIIQDGCSIHIDLENLNKYVNSVYLCRISDEVSDSFERIVGKSTEVGVSDSLYESLISDKSIRIRSYELNNLLNLDEIIILDVDKNQ